MVWNKGDFIHYFELIMNFIVLCKQNYTLIFIDVNLCFFIASRCGQIAHPDTVTQACDCMYVTIDFFICSV